MTGVIFGGAAVAASILDVCIAVYMNRITGENTNASVVQNNDETR